MTDVVASDRPGSVGELRTPVPRPSIGFGLDRELESYRRELTGFCYRMLGSPHEAEDAVQDTFLRAWRSFDTFDGRAPLRSWLYRIATNVCMTMLDGRRRRALPMDLGSSSSPTATLGVPLVDSVWIQPIADDRVLGAGDPAELAVARETIRLAFVAALQHLPPRQRAVLILRDVLRWKSVEVAGLLDASVVSVNGLLRRARATLASRDLTASVAAPASERDRELLARYVDAFERFDVDALVSLLRDDAVLSMPPYSLWLQGRAAARDWLLANASTCGDVLLVPVAANGSAAFAVYKPAGRAGLGAYSLQVLEVSQSGISAIHTFLDPGLFELFDLAPALPQRPRTRAHKPHPQPERPTALRSPSDLNVAQGRQV
jgi:RNA polymerase sigma-70 factor (ECF subfamily)